MERLDKLLAGTGRWSRREVKQLVKSRRVTVDDALVSSADIKCAPSARIAVDGEIISGCGELTYILLNKPAGVLSATEDRRQETVLDLLPTEYGRKGLFPVGRLDKDTVGLLLLTDDGELSHRLLSPKHHVDKVYYAVVEGGPVTQDDIDAFENGITLADGTECMPAGLMAGDLPEDFNIEDFESADYVGDDVEVADIESDEVEGSTVYSACFVTLREGKFHQVKRMLASRGMTVIYLKRLSMGPLKLDPSLEEGQYRELFADEVEALKSIT